MYGGDAMQNYKKKNYSWKLSPTAVKTWKSTRILSLIHLGRFGRLVNVTAEKVALQKMSQTVM